MRNIVANYMQNSAVSDKIDAKLKASSNERQTREILNTFSSEDLRRYMHANGLFPKTTKSARISEIVFFYHVEAISK